MTLNSKRALTVAIDTSTDMLVCALRWTDLETGEEQMLSRDHMCRRHANVELVNTVQAALTEAGFGIADVDAIVVGRGPGSFTGVRIGISTAKGLACGANVPLLGASTLDACAWTAWRAGERGLVGVLADAMRGEVYPALYRIDETGPQRLFDRERVVKAAVALDEWRERADWAEIRLTGDGLVRYGKLLSEDEAARCLERSLWWPSGEGLLRSEATGDGDPAGVLPIYTSGAGWAWAKAPIPRQRALPTNLPAGICSIVPWVRRMPRALRRSTHPALRAQAMRRGLRSSFSMSWRKIFPLRAPGGWRMITATSSVLPEVWLWTTTFRFWTWRSILRIAARALRASCFRT